MTFAQLSVICLVALLGPLLALRRGWRLPVVLGELVAGLLLGTTGIGYLDASDPTFTFLADIGFALVMFVAGTNVPVRSPQLRPALKVGAARAAVVGLVGGVLGVVLARVFDLPHAGLYAVLMASSSAALILPVVDSLGLGGQAKLELVPQVAIADAAAIVVLPLVLDPDRAWQAAGGTAVVVAATGLLLWALWVLEKRGVRQRVHDVSEEREFALELRIQLTLLFALAALAVFTHVSILLAGFGFGVAVAVVGEPRRLARQLFALTEGFLGPLFFVWLGATLDVRQLGSDPKLILLGLCLGFGAMLAHLSGRLLGQQIPLTMLASGQLGVPIAAATAGTQLGLLSAGEAAALMLGALVTIGVAVAGGALATRRLSSVGSGA